MASDGQPENNKLYYGDNLRVLRERERAGIGVYIFAEPTKPMHKEAACVRPPMTETYP